MTGTTDIRRIMDRVTRHPMMRDVPFETAVEYAVDFIRLLGVPALFEEKTAEVPVHDWRGELPCDFESMVQVREAAGPCRKPGRAFRYSGDTFHMSPRKGPEGAKGLTYKIQGGVIFTSVRETVLEIAYRAFAVDAEGFPLLPDNASFLRGLEAYVKLQWFTVLFDLGKIPLTVLQNTQQEYDWAVGDAQSEFNRLDIDKAETLFNMTGSLLPRRMEHQMGFVTAGSREAWHFHR